MLALLIDTMVNINYYADFRCSNTNSTEKYEEECIEISKFIMNDYDKVS